MGKNENTKNDKEWAEELLRRVKGRNEIVKEFVRYGLAEDWLTKNEELIKLLEEEILSKEGDVFEIEEIAGFCYIEKVNREEFDLYEKYYNGEEFKEARIEILEAMIHKEFAEYLESNR